MDDQSSKVSNISSYTDVASILHKLILIVGFVAITSAIFIAYSSPARGYEVSIYQPSYGTGGTPIIYWISLAIALLSSVSVAFRATSHRMRHLSYGLGIISFMSLVMLPLLRGWNLHAGSDALSHLGFTRELANGARVMTDSQYPFFHTVAVFLNNVSGIELEHSFLVAVPAFVLIFALFSPLTARLFSGNRWVVGTAVFSAMLLLPVNHVSGDLTPQPSSKAMLYIVFVLFTLMYAMMNQYSRSSIMFILAALSFVLLHPQHAASLMLMLVSIAAVYWIHTSAWSSTDANARMPVLLQASLLVLFFWVWVQSIIADRFERNLARMVGSLFIDTETASTVQSRGLSLGELGGSMEEMFLKLFLVSVIYCVICAFLMGAVSISTLRPRLTRSIPGLRSLTFDSHARNSILAYWTFGFAAASSLFFIYLLGGISDQYFRHYGFLMASVTILGALAGGKLFTLVDFHFSRKVAGVLAIVFLSICLLVTAPVVFSSPYIYQDSHHVTESTMNGHQTAFEVTDEDTIHTSLRRGVDRYQDALLRGDDPGRSWEETYRIESVPGGFVADESLDPEAQQGQNLHGFFDEPAYLFVKDRDRVFETTVLQGLRWSEEDLAYLEEEPGIDRVQDNGGFTMYFVQDRDSGVETSNGEQESDLGS